MYTCNADFKRYSSRNETNGFITVCAKVVRYIFLIKTVVFVQILPCVAELQVDITRGVVKPIPVAVTNFLGNCLCDKLHREGFVGSSPDCGMLLILFFNR